MRAELQAGSTRQDVLAALESPRPSLSDTQEDAVLGVMDAVVGWCSPHEKLDAE